MNLDERRRKRKANVRAQLRQRRQENQRRLCMDEENKEKGDLPQSSSSSSSFTDKKQPAKSNGKQSALSCTWECRTQTEKTSSSHEGGWHQIRRNNARPNEDDNESSDKRNASPPKTTTAFITKLQSRPSRKEDEEAVASTKQREEMKTTQQGKKSRWSMGSSSDSDEDLTAIARRIDEDRKSKQSSSRHTSPTTINSSVSSKPVGLVDEPEAPRKAKSTALFDKPESQETVTATNITCDQSRNIPVDSPLSPATVSQDKLEPSLPQRRPAGPETKQSVLAPFSLRRSYSNASDSSDEVDLVALARLKAQAPEDPPPAPVVATTATTGSPPPRTNSASCSHTPPQQPAAEKQGAQETKQGSENDNSSDDDDADDERTPEKGSSMSRLSTSPRNPLARMKFELLSPVPQSNEQHVEVSAAVLDDLWADPTPAKSTTGNEDRKKAGRKKRKTDDKMTKDEKQNNGEQQKAEEESKPAERRRKKPKPEVPPQTRSCGDGQPTGREIISSARKLGVDMTGFCDDTIEEEENDGAALKPYFPNPLRTVGRLEPLVLGTSDGSMEAASLQVPASIARYLFDFQEEGVRFMSSALVEHRGAILGDDMGLGKTVQTSALLAALLGKTGTKKDLDKLYTGTKTFLERKQAQQIAVEEALRTGIVFQSKPLEDNSGPIPDSPWAPILISVPSSLVENWKKELKTWGHFAVATYVTESNYDGLPYIRGGAAEIMISKHHTFQQEDHVEQLQKIPWKLIIIDEFHMFKGEKTKKASNLRMLQKLHGTCILGLTGTLMQNKHEELWNLVDIVNENLLGTTKQFKSTFSNPIKNERVRNANDQTKQLAESAKKEFMKLLDTIYLRRTKEKVLGHLLPEKDELIVFCDPSPLQKQVYKYMIEQSDYLLLQRAQLPCDCGVNNHFFSCMQQLRRRDEQLDFFRRKKKEIIPRWKCCWPIPLKSRRGSEIDPDAVLWRHTHEKHDHEACSRCPFCIFFPSLTLLHKVSTHLALIQPEHDPKTLEPGTTEHKKAVRDLEKAQVFIPPELVKSLPSQSLVRSNSVMNDHFLLSGKMKVLAKLLRKIKQLSGKVLVFSAFTQTLDIIQDFVISQGYSFSRMDGGTIAPKRQQLADEFNSDPNLFVFLLSTKAMGLGLNLTSASWVIIFDVEWNPSYDAQAQDRSYRLGQKKDVKVFRLVTKSTVEEMKYLRQVYKTHLKDETIIAPEGELNTASRLFRGVEGDKERRGELFGIGNLIRFKDEGTFMNYGSKAKEAQQFDSNIFSLQALVDQAKEIQTKDDDVELETELRTILADGVPNIAKTATVKDRTKDRTETLEADEDFIGGDSQNCIEMLNNMAVMETDLAPEGQRSSNDVWIASLRDENSALGHPMVTSSLPVPTKSDLHKGTAALLGKDDATDTDNQVPLTCSSSLLHAEADVDAIAKRDGCGTSELHTRVSSSPKLFSSSSPVKESKRIKDEHPERSNEFHQLSSSSSAPEKSEFDEVMAMAYQHQPASKPKVVERRSTANQKATEGKRSSHKSKNVGLPKSTKTTFSLSDLHLPTGTKKKKSRKARHHD